MVSSIPIPRCHNMQEVLAAAIERVRVQELLSRGALEVELQCSPLSRHLLHGLAYTAGSALGSEPPTHAECLSAFTAPVTNTGLTAGAKAWSKHAHRSGDVKSGGQCVGWWGGQPKGPVASINEHAVLLYDRIMDHATWRNLHWLPHKVLVYEVRVEEGYGMRWSLDEKGGLGTSWMFRGFVEPMMENGHQLGWRH